MLGAALSLGSAFFWAGAVILFKKSGEGFSPISLNIYKSFVALLLIALTMLILKTPFFPDKPLNDWFLLAVSGFFGITLSDLFFFMALNRLGAGLMAIVECLYLPSVIFLSFILLGESLTPPAVIGASLVFMAVFVGSLSRTRIPDPTAVRKNLWPGILIGCLSIFLVALGIIIIKELLDQTDVLWANFVRVSAGTASLLIFLFCHPGRKHYLRELMPSRTWLVALPASVSGNYLALLCWVGGMKYTTVSQAAILNQMSTIFIFILAALFLREKITANKTIAIILAVTGAILTIVA